MFCHSCGIEQHSVAKFCHNCGEAGVVSNNNQSQKIVSVIEVVESHRKLPNHKHDESLVLDSDFFTISPAKLALLSIFTLGLFNIYWFVQNWEVIKKSTNANISPFWRGVFSIFFCGEVFRRIINSAWKRGYQVEHDIGWLTASYVIIGIISNVWARASTQGATIDPSVHFFSEMSWIIFSSLSAIPLYIVQKVANEYNARRNPDFTTNVKLWAGGRVLVGIGIAMFVLVFFGAFA